MSKNNKKSKGGRGKKSKVFLPFPHKYATVYSVYREPFLHRRLQAKLLTLKQQQDAADIVVVQRSCILLSCTTIHPPPTFFYFLSVLSIQVRVYSLFLQRTVQNRGIYSVTKCGFFSTFFFWELHFLSCRHAHVYSEAIFAARWTFFVASLHFLSSILLPHSFSLFLFLFLALSLWCRLQKLFPRMLLQKREVASPPIGLLRSPLAFAPPFSTTPFPVQ